MKMLTCASMGMADCDFVGKAETEQEVIDQVMAHVKETHPEKLEGADMEAMKATMMSKMQDA